MTNNFSPNTPPKQTTPVPESAGMFPPLPDHVAPLVTITQAHTAMTLGVRFRDITCFDGTPGTGKTTAASLAAEQVGTVNWKYCVPPQRANTKAMMLSLYEAVFGYPGPLTERSATDALVKRLSVGDIGLVVDEVHHVGVLGLQQLRHVWDRAAINARSFPMLLVGVDVHPTLSKAQEVRQRIARWVLFDTLQHPDDLATLATSLHPRLAVTTPTVIEKINERTTHGSIRDWYQFAKHIDMLPSTATKRPKGLTDEDVRDLRSILGKRP